MQPFTLHLISIFPTHLQIFAADEKTGTGFLLLFSFVFPLAHNRVPGLEKSSRFVECEVKWSSIWLRPRPSLFLPAHWPGTTHTAIYWRQLKCSFIYLLFYFMSQVQWLFAASVDLLGVRLHAQTCITSLFFCGELSEKDGPVLIITNLHQAGVLVLPCGLCSIFVFQMQIHTYTLNPSTSGSATKPFFGRWSTNLWDHHEKMFHLMKTKFSYVGLNIKATCVILSSLKLFQK